MRNSNTVFPYSCQVIMLGKSRSVWARVSLPIVKSIHYNMNVIKQSFPVFSILLGFSSEFFMRTPCGNSWNWFKNSLLKMLSILLPPSTPPKKRMLEFQCKMWWQCQWWSTFESVDKLVEMIKKQMSLKELHFWNDCIYKSVIFVFSFSPWLELNNQPL